jgi:PAS domain S-box-containing protein
MKDALEKKREDLKVAHAAAIAANSFLTGIMNTSPDFIIFVDVDNKITLFNRGAEEITGYDAESLRGKLIDVIFPSTLIDTIKRELREKKRIINHEIGIRRRDGSFVPLLISAATMVENGVELGSVITGQDITIKKELEDKIMENEKLSLLGQLAGEVVHEIKNPVHNIMLAISYLRGNLLGTLGENVDRSIRTIDVQLDRINHIIKNILLFMSPDDEEMEELEIDSIIKNTLNFITPTLDNRVKVKYCEIGEEATLFGNRHQLIQLFINLINNSAGFVGVDGVVEIFGNYNDRNVEIIVRDNGKGFEPGNLHNIFKPFYTTRKGSGGSGLGLTICKKIVESHRGEISAENWENGALVRVKLPLWKKCKK